MVVAGESLVPADKLWMKWEVLVWEPGCDQGFQFWELPSKRSPWKRIFAHRRRSWTSAADGPKAASMVFLYGEIIDAEGSAGL
jgi:hypothetical protein